MPSRAAIIGLGPHGRRILQALAAVGSCELAAVVDRRTETLVAAQLPASTARFRSPDELWAIDDLDLVCITTNGPSHAHLAIEAMNHGVRRLMISKPMACSPAECKQILDLAQCTGTRIAVDHLRRHSPGYVWLRDQIASGVWGAVRCVWTQRPGIGLGCLATHSFDAIRMLTGLEARRVTSWVDEAVAKNPRGVEFVDPGGLVVIELENRARAVVAQIEDGAGPASIEIDLTGARIRLDENTGEIEIFERDASVVPGPSRPPVYRRATVPQGLSALVDLHQGLTALFEELLGNEPLQCHGDHGLAAVEILAAAHLSHRRGNVPVALADEAAELDSIWLSVT